MCCELSVNVSRVLAWLLCLIFASSCGGQTSGTEAIHYRGRIIDESTGKPIESACIKVVPSAYDGAWRTDSRGRFSFWTTHDKNHKLEIEREGYLRLSLMPQGGALNDIRLEPQRTVVSNLTGVLKSEGEPGILSPSQSVAPAVETADSGPRLSGTGNNWSRWYRLGVGKVPQGYTVQKVEFWLTGDRACSLAAQCREIRQSNQQVLWEFRLRGHDEIGAPPRAYSTAHILVVYRSQ